MTPDERVRAVALEIIGVVFTASTHDQNEDYYLMLPILEKFREAVRAEALAEKCLPEAGKTRDEMRQQIKALRDAAHAEGFRHAQAVMAAAALKTPLHSGEIPAYREAYERGRAERTREFDARFADTLKEFGTIERLVDAYREAKMEAREIPMLRSRLCAGDVDAEQHAAYMHEQIEAACARGYREGLAAAAAINRVQGGQQPCAEIMAATEAIEALRDGSKEGA